MLSPEAACSRVALQELGLLEFHVLEGWTSGAQLSHLPRKWGQALGLSEPPHILAYPKGILSCIGQIVASQGSSRRGARHFGSLLSWCLHKGGDRPNTPPHPVRWQVLGKNKEREGKGAYFETG